LKYCLLHIVLSILLLSKATSQHIAGMRSFEVHEDIISAISTSNAMVATASFDGRIKLWEGDRLTKSEELVNGNEKVFGIGLAPQGDKIAYADPNHAVIVYNVQRKQQEHVFYGHVNTVFKVKFSPNGQFVASASADGSVKIWEVLTGNRVADLAHNGRVISMAWHPDGTHLISGTNENIVYLWELSTFQTVRKFYGHNGPITALAFHPSGQSMVSGSLDSKLCLWGVHDGKFLYRFDDHRLGINSISFSSDGQYMLSGSSDGHLRVYDIRKQQLLRSIKPDIGWVVSAKFSADDNLVYGGGQFGRLVSIPTAQFTNPRPSSPTHTSPARCSTCPTRR
jgi:WD40 repeat protein